jgi:hypothetical protein
MDWPALRRFADAIGPDGRARLLRVLEASEEDRAAAIGRLHLRDDGELLEQLLISFAAGFQTQRSMSFPASPWSLRETFSEITSPDAVIPTSPEGSHQAWPGGYM